jgi:hypothetical protein
MFYLTIVCQLISLCIDGDSGVWVWSIGGMILTGEDWSIRSKTCLNATLSTKNSTWSGLGRYDWAMARPAISTELWCGPLSVLSYGAARYQYWAMGRPAISTELWSGPLSVLSYGEARYQYWAMLRPAISTELWRGPLSVLSYDAARYQYWAMMRPAISTELWCGPLSVMSYGAARYQYWAMVRPAISTELSHLLHTWPTLH